MKRSRPNLEEAIAYWGNIALAVLFVFIASAHSDNREAMFYLFGATYFIMHAHGHRLYSALKNIKQEVVDSSQSAGKG